MPAQSECLEILTRVVAHLLMNVTRMLNVRTLSLVFVDQMDSVNAWILAQNSPNNVDLVLNAASLTIRLAALAHQIISEIRSIGKSGAIQSNAYQMRTVPRTNVVTHM